MGEGVKGLEWLEWLRRSGDGWGIWVIWVVEMVVRIYVCFDLPNPVGYIGKRLGRVYQERNHGPYFGEIHSRYGMRGSKLRQFIHSYLSI